MGQALSHHYDGSADRDPFRTTQITPDKCTDGVRCDDPDYNIGTAARYFKSRTCQQAPVAHFCRSLTILSSLTGLDDNGGQFLPSIGQYNVRGTSLP